MGFRPWTGARLDRPQRRSLAVRLQPPAFCYDEVAAARLGARRFKGAVSGELPVCQNAEPVLAKMGSFLQPHHVLAIGCVLRSGSSGVLLGSEAPAFWLDVAVEKTEIRSFPMPFGGLMNPEER